MDGREGERQRNKERQGESVILYLLLIQACKYIY